MLHFIKMANDVMKSIVGNVFTKSISAVPNMMTKLVNCNNSSVFAFIVFFFLIGELYSE